MVIKWKEREHSEENEEAMGNRICMEALRDCGLKKFFMKPFLRDKVELLQYLISFWDVDMDSLLGSSNANVRGWSTDVLETRVL